MSENTIEHEEFAGKKNLGGVAVKVAKFKINPLIKDEGNKLETTSNDQKNANLMVQIAESRGWKEIAVDGSEIFRKEVWEAAAERGISVRGYIPKEEEKEEMFKKLTPAERRAVEPENKPEKQKEKKSEQPQQESGNPPGEIYTKTAGIMAVERIIELKIAEDNLNSEEKEVVRDRVKQNITYTVSQGKPVEIDLIEPVQEEKPYSKKADEMELTIS